MQAVSDDFEGFSMLSKPIREGLDDGIATSGCEAAM